jgi:hypothetical protein
MHYRVYWKDRGMAIYGVTSIDLDMERKGRERGKSRRRDKGGVIRKRAFRPD